MAHILVVEDDPAINDLIVRNLSLIGHDCSQTFEVVSAIRRARGKKAA